jgi:hypothetical protein
VRRDISECKGSKQIFREEILTLGLRISCRDQIKDQNQRNGQHLSKFHISPPNVCPFYHPPSAAVNYLNIHNRLQTEYNRLTFPANSLYAVSAKKGEIGI